MGFLLTIISGIILTIPFGQPQFYYFAWFALLPFFIAIRKDTPRQGFYKGLLLGLTIFFRTAYWLYFPLVEFSGLPFLVAILLLLLLFLFLGSFYGAWAWLYLLLQRGKSFSAFWLAVSWTGIEYLRYLLFSAFPFAYLGYTQVDFFYLLQWADLGGVFLLSFFTLLINAYLYKSLFLSRRVVISLILVFLLIFSYGIFRYQEITAGEIKTSLQLGIVQTNLGAREKWQITNLEPNIDFLLKESKSLEEAHLIIWPESSLTFDLIRNEYYHNFFVKRLQGSKAYIQLGSLAIIDEESKVYNSSFLLSPQGEILARYNKNRLVPFGEYLPMAGLIKVIAGIEMGQQYPGKEVTIFHLTDINWRTAICSEILYPLLVQKEIGEVDFIVNQSNEAWYLKGNLQEQMWTAARFRAVENRRPVVKAGNMAYGGIILASGENYLKKSSKEATAISGELPIREGKETLYQSWGNYVGAISFWLTALLVVLKLIVLWSKKLKK